MRHIHVELTRGSKEELAPVELPSQDGDVPLPAAPSQVPDLEVMRPGVVVPKPFGHEQLRLQKVYQLSIFSQLGGFSASELPRTSEAQPGQFQPGQVQRTDRVGVKRGQGGGQEESHLTHKWPHLAGDVDRERDGGVLSGSGPGVGVDIGMGVGMGLGMGLGVGQRPVSSCIMVDHRDSDGGLSPRSPPPAPLSPGHTPARRPAQHNHDRPVPDLWAPLSPKPSPMVEPHSPPGSRSPLPSTEPRPGGDAPACSLGNPGGSGEGCSSGSSLGQHQPNCCTDGPRGALGAFDTLSPPGGPPGSLSHRFPPTTDPQEPGEGREWGAKLESSPPHPSATAFNSTNGLSSVEKTPSTSGLSSVEKTPSTSGLSSVEKTPSTSGLRGISSGPCPAKKKLLSSSDTGESCSEDEGPSTSKRSRLALLAPGLGLASCRGTDAKAAPFWNHLLPNAQGPDHTKSLSECRGASRRLKSGMRLKSRQLCSGRRTDTLARTARSGWPSSSISRSLLGNFEESILKGRFSPSGRIEGFTAEIGASGSYCPQHATLPVHVTYYDISEHSAPSPFLGVISLEPLGKKGYSVPKAGTIQVTLFNPNKTVVKMFLVTYNFGDMPVNHMTFLRHRIFLVPVEEAGPEAKGDGPPEPRATPTERRKILCYLIHLRFQSSKSGKIYLHNDIRLLFSRKSIEVDTGIPYELKSFTEVPKNPKYSPRV
ncbi:protein FAM214B-like isoform X1 [Salvelinus namaycush]|uniref:Atos homolog protein B n=1 Tax=Salvelinus namaycush TaxID=8040 RepID=A0A8U1F4N2_SALNM|nr:protein FAM214B-like isoform X1 [Salvelinus namaycush]XP_038869735.1 protein FAM214B-like isoform X1 [Salvelinus namaycush]XP_038869736.1 protein FAM214B-like isoform X1 [Salvelinus namaycush]XP_038869737.1 protein FAM214B-like isoform X1 [Salvelinus namaycush]